MAEGTNTRTETVYVVFDGEHVEVMSQPPAWDWQAEGQTVYVANVDGGDSERLHAYRRDDPTPEAAAALAPFVGTRVRLTRPVDRYPHFIAPAGATGVVVANDDPSIVYAVRLDEPLEGAETWDNEILWPTVTGDGTPQDVPVEALEDDPVLVVTLELTRGDAGAIADALELFAGIDDDENTSSDELVRLAALVRAALALEAV